MMNRRRFLTLSGATAAGLAATGLTPALAQRRGAESEEDSLSPPPNPQILQMRRRRACELGLPECEPAVWEQMQQERRDRFWTGLWIGGVLSLVILAVIRANKKRKAKMRKEMSHHRHVMAHLHDAAHAEAEKAKREYEEDHFGPPKKRIK